MAADILMFESRILLEVEPELYKFLSIFGACCLLETSFDGWVALSYPSSLSASSIPTLVVHPQGSISPGPEWGKLTADFFILALNIVKIPESSLSNHHAVSNLLISNMPQTIQLSHMPPELVLHVALYRDVENAAFLKQQLLEGNTDFEYAFIDASMILTTTHVLAAAFRAMNDYLHERLKSRNVHSEIVFALSPNNNIGEAFRKFGIDDTTSNLLVIKVSTSPSVTLESVRRHLDDAVQGVCLEFNNESLHAVSDLGKIRKAYKIATNMPSKGQSKQSKSQRNDTASENATIQETKELEIAVVGAIALRGAT